MTAMDIIPHLFRQLILIRIEMTGDEISKKELAVVGYSKGKAKVKEWRNCETDSLPKFKNNLAVLWITGDQIVTKPYDGEDQTIKRIIKNPELIWSVQSTEGNGQTLSFLRREKLTGLLQSIEKNRLLLVDTWIQNQSDTDTINAQLELLYKSRFISETQEQRVDLKYTLANLLFHKLLLPVLLVFLMILLGNFFINSHYTEQYQLKQSAIQQNRRDTKTNASNGSKENPLIAGYNQIPSKSFALLADRIASYIPSNLFLTSMTLSPPEKSGNIKSKKELHIDFNTVVLKGMVETPGSVTLLAELLEKDAMFSKVKVISLDKKKDSNSFEFELEITL